MRTHRILPCLAIFVVLAGALTGCSRGPGEEELKLAEMQQQFAAAEVLYESLAMARTELAGAKERLGEIEATAERERTDEQKAELEQLPTQIEELTAKVDAIFEELQPGIADILTIGLNDFPAAPETAQALEIYSNEAVIVADDMIVKSGDYKKAGDHLLSARSLYEQAGLTVYQPLLDKIKEYDDWRFITEERFDEIKNGMTKDEVQVAAGVPYYQNIQVNEKKGVETWLYKKRGRGAAAIYFKTKNDKVYGKSFDAVKPKIVE